MRTKNGFAAEEKNFRNLCGSANFEESACSTLFHYIHFVGPFFPDPQDYRFTLVGIFHLHSVGNAFNFGFDLTTDELNLFPND